ncbi:unnamed protein product [Blepharisma stoltei]|uniref:Radial spoke protein 3 n=1 Tax=Blepharisma stoltei TaxID=1481888 RepID=A0AAU9JBJ4_9CILI|nr:unnamed protein product [Blepharisma stoltei]
MATLSDNYQFASEPRTIQAPKSKYREPEPLPPPANIMYDRRIVRGNTYAAMIIPASTQQEIERQQEMERNRRRREKERKQELEEQEREESQKVEEDIIETEQKPIEVEENLLESLETPPNANNATQFEFFVDRPPTPLFIENKKGINKKTQIEDGELFEFDTEVEPILEVIVAKSLEHARMEILEEFETDIMIKHRREFEQIRNAELLEIQRVEAEDIRREEESARRQLQIKVRREQMQTAHQKYIARIVAKRYLRTLNRDAETDLMNVGTFSNPQSAAMHDQFSPWLIERIISILNKKSGTEEFLDNILMQASRDLTHSHSQAVTSEYARRERLRQEQIKLQKETEERKKKRAELRAKRAAEQRRLEFKNRIEEEVIAHGITEEGITKHILHDIDGRYAEHIIGTPGGQFGELLLFFSSLEEVLGKELTHEEITALLQDYIMNCMKAPALVYQNIKAQHFQEYLQFVENLEHSMEEPSHAEENHKDESLENPSQDAENADPESPSKVPQEVQSPSKIIQEAPAKPQEPQGPKETQLKLLEILTYADFAVPRTSLSLIWQAPHEHGIRDSLYEALVAAFVSLYFSKDKEDGTNPIKEKLKIEPLNWLDEGHETAVVRIRIPLKHEESIEAEEKSSDAHGPHEIDIIEDRILLIQPHNEDLSLFVVHQAAQRFFRNELLAWIKNVKAYDGLDLERLRTTLDANAQINEEKLLDVMAHDLPVFDFEIN